MNTTEPKESSKHDEFCEDYRQLTILYPRPEKRMSELRNYGYTIDGKIVPYTEAEIVAGIDEYKRRDKLRDKPIIIDKPMAEVTPDLVRIVLTPRMVYDEIIKNHYIRYYGGFFEYDKEIKKYNKLDDVWVDQESQRVVNNFKNTIDKLKGDITIKLVEEIGGFIIRQKYVNISDIETQLIGVNNGILDVMNYERKDSTRELFVPLNIPLTYNKDADCLIFKQFLKDITSSDDDYRCIQEYMGYCLWNGYHLNHFLIIHGLGRNGKSTLLCVLQALLGKANYSSISIDEFETDRFATSELVNKMANIGDDVNQYKMKFTGVLKKSTGGSTLRAQKKFGHAFEFVNRAKLIFAGNKLPIIEDNSDAFWYRAMLIQFKNKYTVDAIPPDTNLLAKLTTDDEMSGILNFALEGLKRIRDCKHFTYDISTTRQRWEDIGSNSSISNFIKVRCELIDDTTTYITRKDLYNEYVEHCSKVNMKLFTIHMLNAAVIVLPGVKEHHATLEDKSRPEAWKGIRLKPIQPTSSTSSTTVVGDEAGLNKIFK